MIVKLNTNDADKRLEISKITADSYILHVDFHGFSGTNMYYHYDTSMILSFIESLSRIESSNSGVAEFLDIEGNELKFSLNKLGHLEVTGKMIQQSPPPQEFSFGFTTDQTCLRPFIADLTKARANAVVNS